MTFPLLYHAHYSHHLEDLPFWIGLAERQGDAVLELGCGTGRVLIQLLKAGVLAFGLDNDFAMLSLFKDNLAKELGLSGPIPSPIFQADLASFHLSRHFPLIIVPCNTWSTLNPAVRQRSLSRIYAHLSPGGLFVASLPNPAMLFDLPASSEEEYEESFEHPLSGNPVQVSSAWMRGKGLFTVIWLYDHLLPDGNVERVRVDATHHLSTPEQYLDEVHTAGMQVHATWGDFDGSAYRLDAEYLILAAKKY